MIVPAPHNTICPVCQKIVNTGSTDIVRYNGKIFHLSSGCFEVYNPRKDAGYALMIGKGVQLERKPTVNQVLTQAQEILSKYPQLHITDLYVLDRKTKNYRPVTSYAAMAGA